MHFSGRIVGIQNNQALIEVDDVQALTGVHLGEVDEQSLVDVNLIDKRALSPQQRRKAYAMIRDIAYFVGDSPERLKDDLKMMFCSAMGETWFSFANADMTTVRLFISFLIELCLEFQIPLRDSGLKRTDDLEVYLLQSMRHRSCVICGKHADIHHIDAIGIGNDITTTDHRGRKMTALCRIHHQLARSMGWQTFSELFHVVGVVPSDEMIKSLGLMTQKRMNEIDE
ncbi:putative HNHc nuclease [Weissella viridescens]